MAVAEGFGMGDARAATLALLAARAEGATICPSEVARVLAAAAGSDDWRGAMPIVHAAVDGLAAEGLVRLGWKGVGMPVRAGPYRIASSQGDDPAIGREQGSIRSQRLP